MLGKLELLESLAGQKRGILTSPQERQAIQAAIARLEDRNPIADPLTAKELEGDWRLLFTTSKDLLGIDRLPLVSLGEIYQCVRFPSQRIYNFAEVNGPLLSGLVAVSARFEPVSRKRVNVAFERGVIGLQGLLDYQNPSQFIDRLSQGSKLPWFRGIDFDINRQNQQGWLEVTYLDDDMRIGRGNEGSLFVLRKC